MRVFQDISRHELGDYLMGNVLHSIFPGENFIDLELHQCGWKVCDSDQTFGPIERKHYLFCYVISGSGTFSVWNSKESVTYHIEKEQGFLIFPHQCYTYASNDECPWEYMWVEFDGLKVKEQVEVSGLTVRNPVYQARHKDLAKKMEEEMHYITRYSKKSFFHLIGHLYLFLDYLTRSASLAPNTSEKRIRDSYIKEAVAFIEQNYQHNISVEDIAAFCNLNRSYFGKIFHDKVGKSPREFLIFYRMTKAEELLKTTTLSIADVGSAVGYYDQFHFSRAFKKVYGVSPRAWRDEQKGVKKHNMSI